LSRCTKLYRALYIESFPSDDWDLELRMGSL